MPKRTARPKYKASRDPGAEQAKIIKLLADEMRKNLPPPPAAEDVDIRNKAMPPEWLLLVARFATSTNLAEFLDVSPMSLGRWIESKNEPDPLMRLRILALADVCGLPRPKI